MHGSFTPDSAEKFLELMREAGYETSALPDSAGLQTFSELGINPGATQGDVWSGNVADFGEVRGEYIENYDYTRCVRPNGTAYGTGGTCRKGTPAEKEEHDALSQLKQMLPKGEKIVTSSGGIFGSELEKKKTSSKPTAEQITSMTRDELYEGKGAFKPGTEGHQAYKNEIERRHKSVNGLKKRGMSDEKIEEAVWEREAKEVGGRGGSSGEIATAPVPPKPIKDPVPGILRSQAEVKGIIADRPETPNAIRDEMGRPLKLSSDRLKALSQEDLETEWNRAKTTSRKDSLRKEIDRREAEGKLGKLKSDLLETSNKIDEIVKGGGKVGRNDPLSKKLKEQAAAIAGLKAQTMTPKQRVEERAAATPKPLKGQHLANMMMEHANIRNSVAAEHGGEIRSKAAKEQFAAALKKAKVPDKATIKAALVKERDEEAKTLGRK